MAQQNPKITRIEVNFPTPVCIDSVLSQQLHGFVSHICMEYEESNPDTIMWPAGYGSKIIWHEPDEPTWDDTVFCIDVATQPRNSNDKTKHPTVNNIFGIWWDRIKEQGLTEDLNRAKMVISEDMLKQVAAMAFVYATETLRPIIDRQQAELGRIAKLIGLKGDPTPREIREKIEGGNKHVERIKDFVPKGYQPPTVILFGPMGSGKTFNAEAIRKVYGCLAIIDNFIPNAKTSAFKRDLVKGNLHIVSGNLPDNWPRSVPSGNVFIIDWVEVKEKILSLVPATHQ